MKATFFLFLHPTHPLLLQAGSDKGGPTRTMCALLWPGTLYVLAPFTAAPPERPRAHGAVRERERGRFMEFVLAAVAGVGVC